MTEPAGPIDDAELHAWVDRRLGEERRAAVAAWLDAHPEDRRRVNEWQRQNELIERLWGGVAMEPVPARLSIARLIARGWRSRAMATAAALVLLAIGAAGGWMARGHELLQPDRNIEMADTGLEAHRLYVAEKRHPVEVGRDEEQHLVTWLSRRLDRPLRAPDLGKFGLQLLGGRLLPVGGGEPAAQLMYEDGSGNRFTLFVTRGRGEDTAFRVVEQDGVSAFYWVDHDTSYALIGSAPRDRLLEISREIFAQLDRAAP
ncbi:MAG TPA: anti-sigma factor [Geminicoccaceae bacterium]|nr:anti-sigma factor [Geminicoccus sp.]HMU49727.1 anti-sigma factor [Geminicoccaceae bacterium]